MAQLFVRCSPAQHDRYAAAAAAAGMKIAEWVRAVCDAHLDPEETPCPDAPTTTSATSSSTT